MSQCSSSDLIAQACASGFTCRDTPELLALLNQLLCNLSAGGGGGSAGLAQVFAGNGAPTTQIPAFGAGVYYDYGSGTPFNWNPTLNGGAGGWE